MKSFKALLKAFYALAITAVIVSSCTATIKVPKHPAPGQPPPPPPEVKINKN